MRFNTKGTCIYFEVNDSETLSKIDDFLRDLWLECCGHLSLFRMEQLPILNCNACLKE